MCQWVIPVYFFYFGRLVAQWAALWGSDEPRGREGRREEAAEAEPPRHRHSPHFQWRPTLSPHSNIFCRARVTKQAEQDSSHSPGIDYQIIPRTWFALYSPGRHLKHIEHRIQVIYSSATGDPGRWVQSQRYLSWFWALWFQRWPATSRYVMWNLLRFFFLNYVPG